MALKKCRECGHEVASSAPTCPNCGVKGPGKKSPTISAGAGCLIILVFLFILAIAMGDDGTSPSSSVTASSPSAGSQVPLHRVAGIEDVSYGSVRRYNVRVSLPSHYSRVQVRDIAGAIVADLRSRESLNAVSMMFYGPGTGASGVWDVALVEWAPNARWEDAGTVTAGDYASFRYRTEYKPPEPPVASGLQPSGRTGLLGAPLPQGATLTERAAGDPAAGVDPRERYQISASAAEIAGFFRREMPRAGWQRDGASTATALFFSKGRLMIGVLINSRGGTFTLMGS
jgi:hypothetical protein